MRANSDFLNLGLEFWANVKLLNQRLGYAKRRSLKNPNPSFVIPTIDSVRAVFGKEGLDTSKLIDDKKNDWTDYGKTLIGYLEFRSDVLMKHVEPNLLDAKKAKALFKQLKKEYKPKCELPMNKQKGKKKDFAFLTCMVNILVEANAKGHPCDYDPSELTAFTVANFPARTLSRRVDGCFPTVINPIALWEIKEYYYTTTFGSRVADGVYETMLDGMELMEAKGSIGFTVEHMLIVDDYFTWWTLGRSYLCRIIDMLHMGVLDEAIFGKEVIDRIPILVQEWVKQIK